MSRSQRRKGQTVVTSLHGEVWSDIAGIRDEYMGLYLVSNMGRVMAHPAPSANARGRVPGRVLHQGKDNKGYRHVVLWNNFKPYTVKVHRLVAVAFLGPRSVGMTINHKDGNKDNNKADNLEYVTNSENAAHAAREIRKNAVVIHGMSLSLREAVEQFGGVGVSYYRARTRIQRHGWEPESAIRTPAGKTGRPSKTAIAERQAQQKAWR